MNRITNALMAAGLALAGIGAAHATAFYGDIAAPAFYNGSGVPNGDFTIDRSNGVEVALRARERFGSAANITSNGVYYQAQSGICGSSVPGSGCSGGDKARWNYDFSINTQYAGGVLTLQGVKAVLSVDIDPGATVNFRTINIFNNWPDNSYWDGAERTATAGDKGPHTNDFGVQQSANPLFGDSGFQPGFDPNIDGLYTLALAVYDLSDNLLASTSTSVRVGTTAATAVVPEPSSLALLGVALLGAGVVKRRARK